MDDTCCMSHRPSTAAVLCFVGTYYKPGVRDKLPGIPEVERVCCFIFLETFEPTYFAQAVMILLPSVVPQLFIRYTIITSTTPLL